MQKTFFGLILSAIILSSCSQYTNTESRSDFSVEFVDKIVISNSERVDSTRVGGLSSIDYMQKNKYLVISDDRSEYSKARLYEVNIYFDSTGIQDYEFVKTTFLRDKDGASFNKDEVDPESIRYRGTSDTYFFTSEGGRNEDWINPFIRETDQEGIFLSEVEVPEIFHFHKDRGLRVNGGFEGLSFENDTILWYANELPLKEDGPIVGFKQGKYPIRLVRHDLNSNQVLSQYAYHLEKLDDKPIPAGGFYVNSISEILFVENQVLWTMERSYVEGVGNAVKIFEVKFNSATDIQNIKELDSAIYKPVSKRLILDFSNYDHKIDNIEGMTFGPKFRDGNKSLLFISDDNFNEGQETQLWLFKIMRSE